MKLLVLAQTPPPLHGQSVMVQALVSMLDGPYAAEAREALSRFTGLPPETDWKEWLRKAGK